MARSWDTNQPVSRSFGCSPVPVQFHTKLLFLCAFMVISAGVSGGCTQSAITPEATELGMPADWVRGGDRGTVDLNWLKSFDDPQLTNLVSEAVTNNYLL